MDPNTMQRIHATRMAIRALPVSRITKKVIDEDVIRTEMANHGVEDSEDLVEMFATREAKRRLTLRRL
jgi:hypothetical protein